MWVREAAVTGMVTTFEIYLREKNIAENGQDDSNQRKTHTQYCENIQCGVVCLRDVHTKKKKPKMYVSPTISKTPLEFIIPKVQTDKYISETES